MSKKPAEKVMFHISFNVVDWLIVLTDGVHSDSTERETLLMNEDLTCTTKVVKIMMEMEGWWRSDNNRDSVGQSFIPVDWFLLSFSQ